MSRAQEEALAAIPRLEQTWDQGSKVVSRGRTGRRAMGPKAVAAAAVAPTLPGAARLAGAAWQAPDAGHGWPRDELGQLAGEERAVLQEGPAEHGADSGFARDPRRL